MPRYRYSLTQPMLAVVSAMEVAGTTTVERTRAGTRFLIFMTRVTSGCAKGCETATALQQPCHGEEAFQNKWLRENAPSACEPLAPSWCARRTTTERRNALGAQTSQGSLGATTTCSPSSSVVTLIWQLRRDRAESNAIELASMRRSS